MELDNEPERRIQEQSNRTINDLIQAAEYADGQTLERLRTALGLDYRS